MVTYAQGKLAFWYPNRPKSQPYPVVMAQLAGKNLAVANPLLAPYGRASLEVLQYYHLKDIPYRLIQGESVNYTMNYVLTGGVHAAFVALSQLYFLQDQGHPVDWEDVWIPPAESYRPIYQTAVILSRTKEIERAKDFMRFMRHRRVLELIQGYGYEI